MEVLRMGGSRVHLLGAVKGLVSEAKRVETEIASVGPDALALSISPEELLALEAYEGEGAEPSNYEEEVYMKVLGHFGEVEKPPPCFVAALDVGRSLDIPVVAVDMDDESFTDAYVNLVSTLEVIGMSFRERAIRRRKFAAETPEEFVLEFDRVVNKSDGFRRLQEEREVHIAGRITELAGRHTPILAVLDHERTAGVQRVLEGDESPLHSLD